MNHISARLFLFLSLSFALGSLSVALGQVADSPMTRLRPIGSPSAVDQYRSRIEPSRNQPSTYQLSDSQPSVYREAAYRNDDSSRRPFDTSVRQTQFEVPQLPNSAPSSLPGPPPMTTSPRSLPTNQAAIGSGVPVGQDGFISPVQVAPAPSFGNQNRDYAPMTQPMLSNQFSTIDNSCCVTGPSSYTAASAPNCCTPVSYDGPYLAPPGGVQQVVPGTLVPGAVVPGAVVPGAVVPGTPFGRAGAAPAGSLVSFGQEAYPVQVGQGLYGQPVAYVPGQRFRNWLRYIFP